MYIRNGIAYAGEQPAPLKICGVRPLADHVLWVRFNTGEVRYYDCKPLLKYPLFAPLQDEQTFNSVYLDYGVTTWNDGGIDIAPEAIYQDGVPTLEAIGF